MNKILSNIQCGCKRGRSTLDHLVRLETEVRRAFAAGEHQVSIFFDLEKTYDMTWKYGILKDLYTHGLRGLLPKYIERFLSTSQFAVRIKKSSVQHVPIGKWGTSRKCTGSHAICN